MSLCTIQFRSQAIARNTSLQVYIPEGEPPFATLYLLHGLTADHSVWSRRLNIEALIEGQNVLVIMPDGGRSFWANDPFLSERAFEDHVAVEIVDFVDRIFPTLPDAAHRGLAGISMGGYGALLLALKHPERFSATASISGSTYFAHIAVPFHRDDDVGCLSAALPRENDLFHLAKELASAEQRIAIRQSCGEADHLYEYNLAFHQHLEKLGLPHEWVSHVGAHDRATWTSQLPQALEYVIGQISE